MGRKAGAAKATIVGGRAGGEHQTSRKPCEGRGAALITARETEGLYQKLPTAGDRLWGCPEYRGEESRNNSES